MILKLCKYCDKPIVNRKADAVYCGNICRGQAYNGLKGIDPKLHAFSSSVIGAISETLCCYDLLQQGFHVFKAVSPACPCDLIAMKGDQVYRVEVTTARRTVDGKMYHNKRHDKHKYDILACVLLDERAVYYETDLPIVVQSVGVQFYGTRKNDG